MTDPTAAIIPRFTEERISSGKAARLLGISRVEFLALLKARGIPYLDFSAEELAEEIEAASALQSNLPLNKKRVKQ